jgi:predicted acylesterase/phospholipase RssA
MADQSLDATVPGYTGPRRSLILAGGGMRVAYQAGVLRALSELGFKFAHGDGTSGGTMNLAMLLSGLSPSEMCDRWRTLNVLHFGAPMPIEQYLHAWDMTGMTSSSGIRKDVFPHLGIDVPAINRSTGISGTFNVCNFSSKVAEVFTAQQITLDLLVAGISLPILMPAVKVHGDWYTDAVWIKDANLMGAVDMGSEELWLVWCIGNTREYLPGAFNQYVHMIEMAGNGRVFEEFRQIEEVNQRIAAGERPYSLTKPVKVHVIKPRYPVPLDPDFFLGKITAATLIDMGYSDAYRYIETEMKPEGIPLTPQATQMKVPGVGITFSRTMKGTFTLEAPVGEGRTRVIDSASPLILSLTLRILNLDAFLAGDTTVAEINGDLTHPVLDGFTPLIQARIQPKDKESGPDGFTLECRFHYNGSQFRLLGNIRRAARVGALPVSFSQMPFRIEKINGGTGESMGAGVLRHGGGGLLETIRTFHVTNALPFWPRLRAYCIFGWLYLRNLST